MEPSSDRGRGGGTLVASRTKRSEEVGSDHALTELFQSGHESPTLRDLCALLLKSVSALSIIGDKYHGIHIYSLTAM